MAVSSYFTLMLRRHLYRADVLLLKCFASDVNNARTPKAKAKAKATVPRPRPRPSYNAKDYDKK